MIVLKNKDEINAIRKSCAIVVNVLHQLGESVAPGVSTLDLEEIAEKLIKKSGAKPAFKGYKGFPCCLCTSVNDVIVHGIPNKTPLKEGDIVGIDMGVQLEGFFGDSAVTFPVGKIGENTKKLLETTNKALQKGLEQARPSGHVQDISSAVQTTVEVEGYSIVREFVGHGIGRDLHEDPPVPNYGKKGMGPRLQPGMVLAIEPMVNEGSAEVKLDPDGWTARTVDGRFSAHFEHSVAVTPSGPLILTEV